MARATASLRPASRSPNRRLPLGVSSIGVGGWAKRAARGGGAQVRGVLAPAA